MYCKIMQSKSKTIDALCQIMKSRATQILIAVAILAVLPMNETTAQEIRGVVVSAEDGQRLPGANIVLKGTDRGTSTSLNGNFSIEAKEGDVLVVSFIGFETQEVTIGTEPLTVRLTVDVLKFGAMTVTGSRGKPRSNLERPVPVDAISLREINATGQIDLGQALHFVAPSFNAVKFGINDLAPLVDPATLRGLGQDQTLLLVNGKRRHKFAFSTSMKAMVMVWLEMI